MCVRVCVHVCVYMRVRTWQGVCPSSGDLPNPGIEARSPTLQADSLPTEPPGKPQTTPLGLLYSPALTKSLRN